MTITFQKKGAALTAKVSGRLDTSTAPDFEAQMTGALDGVTDLKIDFSELTYISSAGLRTLLILQKRMNQQGSMKVTGVNDIVYEILEVTGFSDILTVVRK